MINDIIKLADHLDRIGEEGEAALLDKLIPHLKGMEIEVAEGEDQDQNYMVYSQLVSISEKAKIINSIAQSGAKLDDWMETYIAQADLMLDNIYDKVVVDNDYEDGRLKECSCEGECDCAGKDS